MYCASIGPKPMKKCSVQKMVRTEGKAFTASHNVLDKNQARREGEKFSRALRRLGAPPSLKNTENGVPGGFFLT